MAQAETDQRAIEAALKRREFIKFCMWEEVRWAWRSSEPRHILSPRELILIRSRGFPIADLACRLASRLSRVLRDYAADEAAFGRRIHEQWSALAEALGGVTQI